MTGVPLALITVMHFQAVALPDTTNTAPPPPPPAAPNAPTAGHGHTSLLLGAAVLGTLAAVHVEGVNEVDDLFLPQPVGTNHLARRIPRELGRFETASGLAGGLYLLGATTHDAGALSSELGRDHPWVPFVAYPVATWVGVSRVVDGRHWSSDVLAGAAVGLLSARLAGSWFGGSDTEARLSPTTVQSPDGHLMVGLDLTF